MGILVIIITFCSFPLFIAIPIWILSEVKDTKKIPRIITGIICIIICCFSVYGAMDFFWKYTDDNYRSSLIYILTLLEKNNPDGVRNAIKEYIDLCNKGYSPFEASSMLQSKLLEQNEGISSYKEIPFRAMTGK